MNTIVPDNSGAAPQVRSLGSNLIGLAAVSLMTSLLTVGLFWMLGFSTDADKLQPPPIPLHASAAANGDNMGVATGPIGEDAEGIFFLDYNTGDLQCLVYYPRVGAFGAHYYTNVAAALGGAAGGRKGKYLMVTGSAVVRATAATNTRPGASLVYVTDVSTGRFAAYSVPWDRTAETAGKPQSGPLIFSGGGQIRNYQLPTNINKAPAAIVDPKQQPKQK